MAYSPLLGEIAEELREAGIPVIDRLSDVPWTPDILHCQHHLEAMTAIVRFPGVPAVYFCHGSVPWEEAPPLHPRIVRYVAVDEEVRESCAKNHGIPPDKIDVILSFVDLERFQARATLPPRPLSALLFCDEPTETRLTPAVREACRQRGIRLDVAGSGVKNPLARPEEVLGRYDLAFANGRVALEALAIGAAVILCGEAGIGPMVTSAEFEKLRSLNFGFTTLIFPFSPKWVTAQIDRYDPRDAAEVSTRIRSEAGLDNAIEAIIRTYREILTEFARTPANPDAEGEAAGAYLRWMCDHVKDAYRIQSACASELMKQDHKVVELTRALSMDTAQLVTLFKKLDAIRKRIPFSSNILHPLLRLAKRFLPYLSEHKKEQKTAQVHIDEPVESTDETLALTIEPLVSGRTPCELFIGNHSLLGSPDHFVRFDLYPEIAPSHMKRHYGWWDIPMLQLRTSWTHLSFDPFEGTISFRGPDGPVLITKAWQGGFSESGSCVLHVSIRDKSKTPERMLTLQSYPLLAAKDVRDIRLKELTVTVTTRCNLKCAMCYWHGQQDFKGTDISERLQEAVLDAAPYLLRMMVSSYGEPLLYPDLEKFISLVKSRMPSDGEVGFFSNGTLLTEERGHRLLESGLDSLIISMDGATVHTYESIRIGAHFDQVVKNVLRISEIRARSGVKKPRLALSYVMLENNLSEIPQAVHLAAELGIESVLFTPVIDPKTHMFRRFDPTILKPLFAAARSIAGRHGITVSFPSLEASHGSLCPFLERAFLTTSQRVIPCCHLLRLEFDHDYEGFGDVTKTPLLEIWGSDAYVEFRRRVFHGDYPSECSQCRYIHS